MTKEKTSASPSVDYADDVELKLEELRELGDKSNGGEIYGRVYRLTMPGVEGGRPSAEFIGVVDEVVDEEYIGRRYGGGDFRLRFKFTKKDKSVERKDVVFHISRAYDKYAKPLEPRPESTVAPQAPATLAAPGTTAGGVLEALKGFKIGEAIASFGLAIKTLRELFPRPKEPDYFELFKIIAANNNKTSVSDAIVIKAMENMNAQTRPQSPLSQLRELGEMFEFFKDKITPENHNDNDGENMSSIIKMAIDYLPLLLQQNNNNFTAAGQKARQFPMVENLIKTDPALAKQFIERARAIYGDANARALANGFGYQMDIVPPIKKAELRGPWPKEAYEENQEENPDENPEENPEEDPEENPEENPEDLEG